MSLEAVWLSVHHKPDEDPATDDLTLNKSVAGTDAGEKVQIKSVLI